MRVKPSRKRKETQNKVPAKSRVGVFNNNKSMVTDLLRMRYQPNHAFLVSAVLQMGSAEPRPSD
jgi:hypothetical protein